MSAKVSNELARALVEWREAKCAFLNQSIAGSLDRRLHKAQEEAEAALYIHSFGFHPRAPVAGGEPKT